MILVIGSGKMALHLSFLLKINNVDFKQWSRNNNDYLKSKADLKEKLLNCTSVCLCISDSALQPFYEKQLLNYKKPIVHFSGALYFKDLLGLHPLMSFSNSTYDPDYYNQIPQALDHPKEQYPHSLLNLFGEIITLNPEKKFAYHCLASVGANLPSIIIHETKRMLTSEGFDPALFKLIFSKAFENAISEGPESLTGPISRQDSQTLEGHLSYLEKNKEMQKIYNDLNSIWKKSFSGLSQ